MWKSLIIKASLILNVLAQQFNPQELLGDWRVLAVVHSKNASLKSMDSCVKLSFNPIENGQFQLDQKALRVSQHISLTSYLKLVGSVLETVEDKPNKVAYKLTVLDINNKGDLVLFLDTTNMYLLLGRGMHLSPEITEKYGQYDKYQWHYLNIEHVNCLSKVVS